MLQEVGNESIRVYESVREHGGILKPWKCTARSMRLDWWILGKIIFSEKSEKKICLTSPGQFRGSESFSWVTRREKVPLANTLPTPLYLLSNMGAAGVRTSYRDSITTQCVKSPWATSSQALPVETYSELESSPRLQSLIAPEIQGGERLHVANTRISPFSRRGAGGEVTLARYALGTLARVHLGRETSVSGETLVREDPAAAASGRENGAPAAN